MPDRPGWTVHGQVPDNHLTKQKNIHQKFSGLAFAPPPLTGGFQRSLDYQPQHLPRKKENEMDRKCGRCCKLLLLVLFTANPATKELHDNCRSCVSKEAGLKHMHAANKAKRKAAIDATEPAAKRQKKVKPDRVEFYAREGIPEFGTVVSGPAGYGEWRTVPGFSAAKLRVSNTGFYQIYGKGRWLKPSAGTKRTFEDGTKRHKATVDEKPYMVYQLVLRAFEGPQPPGTTADHKDQNTSNNNSYNLKWATPTEQNENRRTDMKAHSNGKPVRIRHKEWPVDRDWESFENATRAAKAYGLNEGSARRVARGDRTHTDGFLVEYLPADESQEPLGIGDDSNLAAPPLDPPPADKLGAGPSTTIEVWKMAPGVDNLFVSTRGRVQTKDSRGEGWSYMHTPVAVAGHTYATVRYKGNDIVVHRLVWMTFVGPIPKGMTIDHLISNRKFDNRISALRLATMSTQNTNQDRKPISERSNSLKTAVRGRPVKGGDDTWETFESACDAGRVLHARFPEKKFDSSAIGSGAHAVSEGKKAVRYGWVFEYV